MNLSNRAALRRSPWFHKPCSEFAMFMRSALIGNADGVKFASTDIKGSRQPGPPLFFKV
ncbi:hypothetical protein D3C78_1524010 [compost metagenome]